MSCSLFPGPIAMGGPGVKPPAGSMGKAGIRALSLQLQERHQTQYEGFNKARKL